jgi:hypothetical protein
MLARSEKCVGVPLTCTDIYRLLAEEVSFDEPGSREKAKEPENESVSIRCPVSMRNKRF